MCNQPKFLYIQEDKNRTSNVSKHETIVNAKLSIDFLGVELKKEEKSREKNAVACKENAPYIQSQYV